MTVGHFAVRMEKFELFHHVISHLIYLNPCCGNGGSLQLCKLKGTSQKFNRR